MKRKRPDRPLREVLAQRPETTDTTSRGIDKRVTTLKLVDKEPEEGETGGLLTPTLFVPTDEQLAKINKFTLRNVSAEEVACFTTMSCNDLADRDDDRFRTEAVKGFAKLAYPYSPTGKSYMVGHDYTKLAVGRIFDTDTKSVGVETVDGNEQALFLTNDVYIPRTAANQQFIENLEFGVNWAVSVGVVLGKSECEIGKTHDWGFWWFCSKGHEQGEYYDPNSDEEDDWGYPKPTEAGAKGAVKCIRQLDDAKDMYELSQVFLGAQYMAEVSKRPGIAAVVKGAAHHFPVVGLKRIEAMEVPTPKLPERVTEANRRHTVTESEGSFSWADDEGLTWSFTPGEDADPLCLGRTSKASENQAKLVTFKAKRAKATEEQIKSTEGAAVIATQLDGLINELDDALDSDNDDAADTLIDQVQDLMDQLFDELYTEEPASEETEDQDYNEGKNPKEDYMSKKAVLAAVHKVSFPRSVIELVEAAPEEGHFAFETLISESSKMLAEMAPKATAGEAWLKQLRADVIDMYVKSKAGPGSGTAGVDVSHIEKLLDRVGDDPEVMKTLRDEYESALQAKFPQAVRRSSVEENHNAPDGAADVGRDIEARIDSKSVKRIHG